MKSRQKFIAAFVVCVVGVAFMLLAGGMQPRDHARSAPAPTRLRVVTSTGIFADMARNVGGDAVHVTALIPPGADPHTWEPSIREMRALADADIFIYNGLGLEPWVDRVLAAVAPRDLTIVVLSAGLPVLGDAHFHVGGAGGDRGPVGGAEGSRGPVGGAEGNSAPVDGAGDPHMWLDVQRGIAYVLRMEAEFIAAVPEHADDIRQQSATYVGELEELDTAFRQWVDEIPPARRMLVTDHDAYVYMAERYGLTRAGFVTANPDREPSAREMAALVATVRQSGAPALFTEPQIGASFIDELARETGVKVGVLYTDSFYGDVRTYVDMMRANGMALRTFLGE